MPLYSASLNFAQVRWTANDLNFQRAKRQLDASEKNFIFSLTNKHSYLTGEKSEKLAVWFYRRIYQNWNGISILRFQRKKCEKYGFD